MYYAECPMYDGGMQIMIPSQLKQIPSIIASQYMWLSDDKKTLVNVTRGNVDLDEYSLRDRFDEYHRRFKNNIKGFKTDYIKERNIHCKTYIEMAYHSKMNKYDFFNIFMLGIYEGREMFLTIQCIENNKDYNMRVLEYIRDSLRVLKKTPMTNPNNLQRRIKHG